MDETSKLILIGGGGHCKSCIDAIELENKFEIIGILDSKGRVGQKVFGYNIVGTNDDIEKFAREGYSFLITFGQIETAEFRIRVYEMLENFGAKIATVISPLAHVSKYAEIQQGTVILHNALINAGAKVGKNCIINTKALIEHDAVVGDHCHISTGAIVNGTAVIGENSFVGSNATVVNAISVPKNSFIKAGSLAK